MYRSIPSSSTPVRPKKQGETGTRRIVLPGVGLVVRGVAVAMAEPLLDGGSPSLYPGLFTESPKTPAADLECGGRKEKCGSGCAGGEQELALEKYRHSAGTRGVSRFWSGLTKLLLSSILSY